MRQVSNRRSFDSSVVVAAIPADSSGVRIISAFTRLVIKHESFWSVVYEPFMSHDLTRIDVHVIVEAGLDELIEGGDQFKQLLTLFNLRDEEYDQFVKFLCLVEQGGRFSLLCLQRKQGTTPLVH